jgi:hypothetical protein
VDNHLLAALGAEDYARIASTLDIVPLKLKDIIHKPGEPIRHVYFPVDGAGPDGLGNVPAHAGVRRDDARRDAADRQRRRGHAAARRADHVSPRARHGRRSRAARAASCECYATATNLLRDVTNHSSR